MTATVEPGFGFSLDVDSDITELAAFKDKLGRWYNPKLHPRGRDGRFIETFGMVRLYLRGQGQIKPDATAKIIGYDEDTGDVEVEVTGGADGLKGQRFWVNPQALEGIEKQANISGKGPKALDGKQFKTAQGWVNTLNKALKAAGRRPVSGIQEFPITARTVQEPDPDKPGKTVLKEVRIPAEEFLFEHAVSQSRSLEKLADLAEQVNLPQLREAFLHARAVVRGEEERLAEVSQAMKRDKDAEPQPSTSPTVRSPKDIGLPEDDEEGEGAPTPAPSPQPEVETTPEPEAEPEPEPEPKPEPEVTPESEPAPAPETAPEPSVFTPDTTAPVADRLKALLPFTMQGEGYNRGVRDEFMRAVDWARRGRGSEGSFMRSLESAERVADGQEVKINDPKGLIEKNAANVDKLLEEARFRDLDSPGGTKSESDYFGDGLETSDDPSLSFIPELVDAINRGDDIDPLWTARARQGLMDYRDKTRKKDFTPFDTMPDDANVSYNEANKLFLQLDQYDKENFSKEQIDGARSQARKESDAGDYQGLAPAPELPEAGPEPAVAPPTINTVNRLIDAAKEGGFTFDPRGDNFVAEGFAVARQGFGAAFDMDDPDLAKNVEQYILDKWDDLEVDEALHLGGWVDTETNKLWIDLSDVVTSQEQAEVLGKERGEIAIADLAKYANGEDGEIRLPYDADNPPPEGAPAWDAWNEQYGQTEGADDGGEQAGTDSPEEGRDQGADGGEGPGIPTGEGRPATPGVEEEQGAESEGVAPEDTAWRDGVAYTVGDKEVTWGEYYDKWKNHAQGLRDRGEFEAAADFENRANEGREKAIAQLPKEPTEEEQNVTDAIMDLLDVDLTNVPDPEAEAREERAAAKQRKEKKQREDAVTPDARGPQPIGRINLDALEGAEGNDTDSDKLDAIREDFGDGVREPITITYDPNTDKFAVTEGNNRVTVSREKGLTDIPARVVIGAVPPGRGKRLNRPSDVLLHGDFDRVFLHNPEDLFKDSWTYPETDESDVPSPAPEDTQPITTDEYEDLGEYEDDELADTPTTVSIEAPNTYAAGSKYGQLDAIEGEDFPPTPEQSEIIGAVLAGKDVIVRALAGTGKTSTLKMIARRMPKKKILYLAFNRAIKEEAADTMPRNVEAITANALAWNEAPKWMQAREEGDQWVSKPADVAKYLGIPKGINKLFPAKEKFDSTDAARAVRDAVDKYAKSDADELGLQHFNSEAEATVLMPYAKKYWEDVNDPKGRLKLTQEHMIKRWALTRPAIQSPHRAITRGTPEVVFFDEAQDINPVLAKVLRDQKGLQIITVGDSNQAIYGFRGADRTQMDKMQADEDLPLTKSWRFGPQIAGIGNRFLKLIGSPYRIDGGGPEGEILERGTMSNADAVLTRSNAGMLSEILREQEGGRLIGVPAKTKNDLRSLNNSIRWLQGRGKKPRTVHGDVADYDDWDDLQEQAESGRDRNAEKILNIYKKFTVDQIDGIVEQLVDPSEGQVSVAPDEDGRPRITFPSIFKNNPLYEQWMDVKSRHRPRFHQEERNWSLEPRRNESGFDDPKYQQRLKDFLVDMEEELGLGEQRIPDVVISTAHKSKGLEWDRVRIADDFWGPRVNRETGEVILPSTEEQQLAYVAVTRAKKELDPGSLDWIFNHTTAEDELPEIRRPDDAPETPAAEEAREANDQLTRALADDLKIHPDIVQIIRDAAGDDEQDLEEIDALLTRVVARPDRLFNRNDIEELAEFFSVREDVAKNDAFAFQEEARNADPNADEEFGRALENMRAADADAKFYGEYAEYETMYQFLKDAGANVSPASGNPAATNERYGEFPAGPNMQDLIDLIESDGIEDATDPRDLLNAREDNNIQNAMYIAQALFDRFDSVEHKETVLRALAEIDNRYLDEFVRLQSARKFISGYDPDTYNRFLEERALWWRGLTRADASEQDRLKARQYFTTMGIDPETADEIAGTKSVDKSPEQLKFIEDVFDLLRAERTLSDGDGLLDMSLSSLTRGDEDNRLDGEEFKSQTLDVARKFYSEGVYPPEKGDALRALEDAFRKVFPTVDTDEPTLIKKSSPKSDPKAVSEGAKRADEIIQKSEELSGASLNRAETLLDRPSDGEFTDGDMELLKRAAKILGDSSDADNQERGKQFLDKLSEVEEVRAQRAEARRVPETERAEDDFDERIRGRTRFVIKRGVGNAHLLDRIMYNNSGQEIRKGDIVFLGERDARGRKPASGVARPENVDAYVVNIVASAVRDEDGNVVTDESGRPVQDVSKVVVRVFDPAYVGTPHPDKALRDKGLLWDKPYRDFDVSPRQAGNLELVAPDSSRAKKAQEQLGVYDRRLAGRAAGRIAPLVGKMFRIDRMRDAESIQDRFLTTSNGKMIGEGDVVQYRGQLYEVIRPNNPWNNNWNPRVRIRPLRGGDQIEPIASQLEWVDNPQGDVFLRGAGGVEAPRLSDVVQLLDRIGIDTSEIEEAVEAKDYAKVARLVRANDQINQFLDDEAISRQRIRDRIEAFNSGRTINGVGPNDPVLQHEYDVAQLRKNVAVQLIAARNGNYTTEDGTPRGPDEALRRDLYADYQGDEADVKLRGSYIDLTEKLFSEIRGDANLLPGNNRARAYLKGSLDIVEEFGAVDIRPPFDLEEDDEAAEIIDQMRSAVRTLRQWEGLSPEELNELGFANEGIVPSLITQYEGIIDNFDEWRRQFEIRRAVRNERAGRVPAVEGRPTPQVVPDLREPVEQDVEDRTLPAEVAPPAPAPAPVPAPVPVQEIEAPAPQPPTRETVAPSAPGPGTGDVIADLFTRAKEVRREDLPKSKAIIAARIDFRDGLDDARTAQDAGNREERDTAVQRAVGAARVLRDADEGPLADAMDARIKELTDEFIASDNQVEPVSASDAYDRVNSVADPLSDKLVDDPDRQDLFDQVFEAPERFREAIEQAEAQPAVDEKLAALDRITADIIDPLRDADPDGEFDLAGEMDAVLAGTRARVASSSAPASRVTASSANTDPLPSLNDTDNPQVASFLSALNAITGLNLRDRDDVVRAVTEGAIPGMTHNGYVGGGVKGSIPVFEYEGRKYLLKSDSSRSSGRIGRFSGAMAEETVSAVYRATGLRAPLVKRLYPDASTDEPGQNGGDLLLIEVNDVNAYPETQWNGPITNGILWYEKSTQNSEVFNGVLANSIIYNPDRHNGNIMSGETLDNNGDPINVPVFLDHGLAMFSLFTRDDEEAWTATGFTDPAQYLETSGNVLLDDAKAYARGKDKEQVISEIVEFATRMRDRADALNLADTQAQRFLILRSQWVIDNAERVYRGLTGA